jgi:hypothetical protein
MNITYSNANSKAVHWTSIYGEDTAIGPDREIDGYVEAAASDVGTESDGIDVVEFVFRLAVCGGHDGLDELVLTGGDD